MSQLTASERVVELLRTMREAEVSYGAPSTGEGLRLMPSMWNEGSYQELEQRLREMRDGRRRQLWWHVSQRYRWGTQRLAAVPVVRTIAGPQFVLPPNWELVAGGSVTGNSSAVALVYTWPMAVDERLVRDGVESLTESMYDGAADRIVLPLSVLRRKLGLPLEPEPVAA